MRIIMHIKISRFAAGVIALFFLWSCQKESHVVQSAETSLSFKVQTGEFQTKTISDGSNIDILYYEIYGSDIRTATSPLAEGEISETDDEGNFILDLSLIKDQTYHFVFWAQVNDQNHYDVSDLRMIKILDYSDENANDESRAAFYAYEIIDLKKPVDETIKLYRPFAQLNIGTSTYNTSLNVGEPLTVLSSGVTVSKVADSFNTLDSEGIGFHKVTFKNNKTPNGADDASKKLLEANGSKYYWLGMNYLIVNGKDSNIVVDINIETSRGDVYLNVPNVPIKENHRTNIIGDLLTTEANFKVIVDKNFKKNDIVVGEDGEIISDGSVTTNP